MAAASISRRISARIFELMVNCQIWLALDREGRARRKAIFSALKKYNEWFERLPVYDLPRYREVVRDLPRPSAQQISDFVQFVSGAHSWYKHISGRRPSAVFQFYLDPCAGCELRQAPDGSMRVRERTEQDPVKFHYTWMPTRVYRERFGHLAYHCNHGTGFMVRGGGTVSACGEPEAFAVTQRGEPFLVPTDIGCVALPRTVRSAVEKPERERQHRMMHETITRMLHSLDS